MKKFREWLNESIQNKKLSESEEDEDEEDEDEYEDFDAMPKWSDDEIKKARKDLKKRAKDLSIDKVDIENFVYQSRFNGCDCHLAIYSAGKEITKETEWPEFRELMAEALRKWIVNQEDIPVSAIQKLLPGIKILDNGKEVEASDYFEIEEGFDS